MTGLADVSVRNVGVLVRGARGEARARIKEWRSRSRAAETILAALPAARPTRGVTSDARVAGAGGAPGAGVARLDTTVTTTPVQAQCVAVVATLRICAEPIPADLVVGTSALAAVFVISKHPQG